MVRIRKSAPLPPVRCLTGLLLALASGAAHGQATDPRGDFLNALGTLSLALDGTYGDEGRSIATSLDSMAETRRAVGRLIQTRERAMAAEIRERRIRSLPPACTWPSAACTLTARASPMRSESYVCRDQRPDPSGSAMAAGAGASASDRRRVRRDNGVPAGARTRPAGSRADIPACTATPRTEHSGGWPRIAAAHPAQSGPARVTSGNALFIRLDLVQRDTRHQSVLSTVLYADGFASLQHGDFAKAMAQLRESARRDPLTSLETAPGRDAIARAAAAFRCRIGRRGAQATRDLHSRHRQSGPKCIGYLGWSILRMGKRRAAFPGCELRSA